MCCHNGIRLYNARLHRHFHPIRCRHCDIEPLPSQYERHCGDLHGLDPKTHCVWCDGQVSWPAKQKYKFADHLMECFFKFMNPEESIVIPVRERRHNKPTTFTRFNMEYICPEKDFNGRQRLLDILPEEAYLQIGQVDLDPLPLTYQDENSNLATACVKKYLKTVGKTEWFHVMVRATAFQSFLDAVNEDGGGKTRILPFSCWCDGGTKTYAKYRHHRHMIAFAPRGHFLKNVWGKVVAFDKPGGKNYKCKFYKGIESARHLVNTIKYVSQYKSKCKGSFDCEDTVETERHFHVFKGLPKDIKYILSTLWDGGVLEWIAEKYQNMSQNVLALSKNVDYREGQFRLQIGDIPGITLDLVLPVSRCFVPTSDPTEYFVYLCGGRRLYFEKLDPILPEDEWFRRQVAGGNLFFNAVAEEWWKPRQRLQKVLHTVRLVVADRDRRLEDLQTENLKLKAENVELKEENLKMKAEMVELRAEMAKLRAENAELKAENAEFRAENVELKATVAKLEAMVKTLKTMVETLKIENAQLKDENARLQIADMENGHLKTQINLLNENIKLEAEIGQLKLENSQKDVITEQLKAELVQKDAMIEQLKAELVQKDTMIEQLKIENSQKDAIIEQFETVQLNTSDKPHQSKRKFDEMNYNNYDYPHENKKFSSS